MNTDLQDLKYMAPTEKIIKIFYRVYNKLGYGFLEKDKKSLIPEHFKNEQRSVFNRGGESNNLR